MKWRKVFKRGRNRFKKLLWIQIKSSTSTWSPKMARHSTMITPTKSTTKRLINAWRPGKMALRISQASSPLLSIESYSLRLRGVAHWTALTLEKVAKTWFQTQLGSVILNWCSKESNHSRVIPVNWSMLLVGVFLTKPRILTVNISSARCHSTSSCITRACLRQYRS